MRKLKKLKVNKFLFLFFYSFLYCWQSFSQTNHYTVTFNCFLSNIKPLKVPDSIALIRNGQSVKIPWSASPNIKLSSKLMSLKVSADNQRSSIIIIDKSSGWGENSYGKLPDSSVYMLNKWVVYSKGRIMEIPFKKEEYLLTKEEKTILGYTCKKVITLNYKGEKEMESWVTEKLPATIMPYSGSKHMKGAILQSKNIRTGITYTAIEIYQF